MEVIVALTALTLTFLGVVKEILTEDASQDEEETTELECETTIQIKLKRK